jgi:hypothetical protein
MGLLYLFTYCTHPRISNGPALGRIGLYIIRACKHPVIATCPFFAVLTQQSLTAPRLLSYVGSTTIWFCCACHLQLILVVWGWLFRVTALRLTRRSASPQGARHFVFIMSGIELAHLFYLFIITELILEVKFGSCPGNITIYSFHSSLLVQGVSWRDP